MFWMLSVPRFWFNFQWWFGLTDHSQNLGSVEVVATKYLTPSFLRLSLVFYDTLLNNSGLLFVWTSDQVYILPIVGQNKNPKKSYFSLKKYSFDVATKSNWKFTYQIFKFIISYLRISWFSFRASSVYVMFVVFRWNDAQLPSTYD